MGWGISSDARPSSGRWFGLFTCGATVFAILLASAIATAPTASSRGKVQCKQASRTAVADPIVYHNMAVGNGHLHQFFGNSAFLSLANPNAATYSQLLRTPTSCENLADTASYWAPALQHTATGTVVSAPVLTAYYRSWDSRSFGEGVPYPDDVRLVAYRYNWTCGQRERVDPQPSIPDCSMADGRSGSRLTAHIDFPSCWDGVKPSHHYRDVGDTRDNAHFAYRLEDETCPPGFPVKTVELRVTIQYEYTGKGEDVMLSSDHHAGVMDGMSMHADFWNAWQPDEFTSFVRNCVNPDGDRTASDCS
jgi:hypothetical protein